MNSVEQLTIWNLSSKNHKCVWRSRRSYSKSS